MAFYLPQFHPIPENDRWWGPGFTEWHNVVRATPQFPGHEQPHLPADLGFYDLRLAETRIAQARLAAEYGVHAFCYYHYWFGGRRLLGRPLDEVLSSGEPDLPFMLCWANEDWRANWDGRSGEVLVGQEHSDADDRAHGELLAEIFCDPRYLRIDGRPLFLVYRAGLLPDPKATTDRWRRAARTAGLEEPLLARVESFHEDRGDPRPLGFDASVEFQPDWAHLPPALRGYGAHRVYDYLEVVEAMLRKPSVPWPRFPGVTPRWDNTARNPEGAVVLSGSSPARYQRWLAEVVERAGTRDDLAGQLVFVNAWNEWAEGAHLEPDRIHGRAYLEAHQAAMRAESPSTPVAQPVPPLWRRVARG